MSLSAHGLAELRRLLTEDASAVGRVTRVDGSRIEVATARGLRVGVSADQIRVGQQVIFSGGVVRRAVVAGAVYAL